MLRRVVTSCGEGRRGQPASTLTVPSIADTIGDSVSGGSRATLSCSLTLAMGMLDSAACSRFGRSCDPNTTCSGTPARHRGFKSGAAASARVTTARPQQTVRQRHQPLQIVALHAQVKIRSHVTPIESYIVIHAQAPYRGGYRARRGRPR